MLRSAAVSRIQEGLGFRTSLSTQIIARLQEEQRDLERGKTLPRFLISEGATLTLAQGTNSVALPANFLRRTNALLRYVPASTTVSTTIPWKEYDAAYEEFAASNPSGPVVAILRGSSIYFLPTADVEYTITWDYYAKGVVLDTDIENIWLANAPELLIGGAGLRIAKDARNQSAIKLFTEMYQQARQTWYGETILQESEDGPLILGANA